MRTVVKEEMTLGVDEDESGAVVQEEVVESGVEELVKDEAGDEAETVTVDKMVTGLGLREVLCSDVDVKTTAPEVLTSATGEVRDETAGTVPADGRREVPENTTRVEMASTVRTEESSETGATTGKDIDCTKETEGEGEPSREIHNTEEPEKLTVSVLLGAGPWVPAGALFRAMYAKRPFRVDPHVSKP